MNARDYDKAKAESWNALWDEVSKRTLSHSPLSMGEVFDYAFDRTYRLGMEAAKEQPLAERLTEEEKKQLKDFHGRLSTFCAYIPREYDFGLSRGLLAIEGILGKEFFKNQNKKTMEEIKISGWVARDNGGFLGLYPWQPDRGDVTWLCGSCLVLPISTFPDLTWDSDPIEVEIIIKRNNNG